MLFQKKCPFLYFLVFVCALLFATGCGEKSKTTDDYNLGEPEITVLGPILNEISGICYYNNNGDSALLAIVDSKERVFKLEMKAPQLKDHTEKILPNGKDPEDIVKVDSFLYVLFSNGTIQEIPDKAKDSNNIKTYTLPLGGTNDFETIYHDPSVNSLVILCKSCSHERKGGIRTAYRFDLATKAFDTSSFFTIEKEDVKTLLKDAGAKFDPSAAAIHPINKRLYILSSAGNLLVITDSRGAVTNAHKLNKDYFPQSEGIAFAPNGDMYISNEKKHGEPTLLRFPYQPNKKKK